MYHYIRNKSKLFPNYNILEKKNYTNQIKNFSEKGLINSYEELFISSDKFLPTFDDGFKDHIFVAPFDLISAETTATLALDSLPRQFAVQYQLLADYALVYTFETT
jgi:hypothetical protein